MSYATCVFRKPEVRGIERNCIQCFNQVLQDLRNLRTKVAERQNASRIFGQYRIYWALVSYWAKPRSVVKKQHIAGPVHGVICLPGITCHLNRQFEFPSNAKV